MVLVDALRPDFVSPLNTPFINSLGKTLPMKTILGYSDGARASIFSGTYPETHGYWIKCCYRPDNSPYKALAPLSFLDKAPNFYARRLPKMVIGKTLCKLLDFVYGYHGIDIYNMPIAQSRFFDLSLNGEPFFGSRLKVPTVFDLFEERNAKFRYINSAHLAFENLFKLESPLSSNELVVYDIHYLDYAAHRFGLNNPIYSKYLHFIDDVTKKITKNVSALSKETVDTIVFSDHGITESDKNANFDFLLKDKSFGKEFVCFLDSTIIHFWYLNSSIKGKIRQLLESYHVGSFLSKEQIHELHINFSNRLYGDDVFLVDPPYSLFPNFISLVRPKAMHAYHPMYAHQHGMFSFKSETAEINPDVKKVNIVDIMPTMLDAMGIAVPETCEGRSVLNH